MSGVSRCDVARQSEYDLCLHSRVVLATTLDRIDHSHHVSSQKFNGLQEGVADSTGTMAEAAPIRM